MKQQLLIILQYHHRLKTSETCTELPLSMSHMTASTTFPVIVGTVVEVRCPPGHTQAGDNTITCIEGTSFTVGERPTCTIGKTIRTK